MLRGAVLVGLSTFILNAFGATFGTVVPVRGTVSDIALDESRGRLYIANYAAYQVAVMNTADQSFATPLSVPKPPSSLSLAANGRYLVVGEDAASLTSANSPGGFTVFDLSTGNQRQIDWPDPVLTVAFGGANRAFVITAKAILLLDPSTGVAVPIATAGPYSVCLPVPFASFPPAILQADAGVSGDGTTIIALVSIGAVGAGGCAPSASSPPVGTPNVAIIRYTVGTSTANVSQYTTAPTLGPRTVSVDQFGQTVLAGWGLTDASGVLLAQFPYPTGVLNIGSHAWDRVHNRIFAQIPATGDGAVLHVVDTDNLTVRERIQLPENLAGHTVWSSDGSTLYAVSISGVTVFPMGKYDTAHRVGAQLEDVFFQADACNPSTLSKYITLADLGGGSVDFSLSLPANTQGIRLTPSSGTTPASVRIDVDPTVFQGNKGTTVIPLTITSNGSINLPAPVRILISTPDVNEHGRIINVPGKITDILADRSRKRVYVMRQDKNLILVYDANTFQQIAAFRTGNTPVGMAVTVDSKYLIVGSDNSQIDNVFDLDALQPTNRIVLPGGTYGRSIAAGADGQIFQIVRSISADPSCPPPGCVVGVNLTNRTATAAATLGIYKNLLSSADGILAETRNSNTILMALADGTVVLYDASVSNWVASRKDFAALGGAAGGFNDNLFLVDNHVLNAALVQVGDLEHASGASSGMGFTAGQGIRTTSGTATAPGTIERVDLTLLQASPGTLIQEAPLTPALVKTPTVGQIGQTILPFGRYLAIPYDQSSVIVASVSGMTVVEPAFDLPTSVPVVSSVRNAGDGSAAVAPGGLVTINGTGLAAAGAAAMGLPLPSTLGNTCVSIGSAALALFNVSPTQIMGQLPYSASGASPLLVRTAGGVSNPLTVNVQSFAPAIFHNGQAGTESGIATVIRSANNELVTFTNPIHPDETISIYLTGMAQTSPLPALGNAAPSDPLAMVNTPPVVTLGGLNLPVLFAGLVPGEVGVYQIDAYVPRGIKDAKAAPLTITQGPAVTTYAVRTVSP